MISSLCDLNKARNQNKALEEDVDLLPEELASYRFVEQIRGRADGALDLGTSPFWHGWALREAFLAGVRWKQKGEQ